jgi:integrase
MCEQDTTIFTRESPRHKLPRHREAGLNFVITHQHVVRGEFKWFRPRLYFIEGSADGEMRATLCTLLDDYFDEFPKFKDQWRRNTARAVGLFSDYSRAKLAIMTEEERAAPDEILEKELLKGCARAMKFGTVPKGTYAEDPLGLRWHAKGENQARIYLSSLANFLAWVGDQTIDKRWGWLNKSAPSSASSALRVAAELAIRRKNSLLAHLKGTPHLPIWHAFAEGTIAAQKTSTSSVNSFPAKWLVPFLFEAFDLNLETELTAATMAAVLACSGFRMSELFHTYLSDIQFTEDATYLFAYHPSESLVKDGHQRLVTRQEHLSNLELSPRHLTEGAWHAGWKGMADDVTGTLAYWLPIPALRQRVRHMLRHYIFVVRPSIMARRPRNAPHHPFLFVSPNAGEGNVGDPYTISAFLRSWRAAIARLSRILDDPAIRALKALGTTPHGLRLFFGRYLKSIMVPGEIIMRCMNHRSFRSHLVYGRLTHGEINDVVTNLSEGKPYEPVRRSEFLRDVEAFDQMRMAA